MTHSPPVGGVSELWHCAALLLGQGAAQQCELYFCVVHRHSPELPRLRDGSKGGAMSAAYVSPKILFVRVSQLRVASIVSRSGLAGLREASCVLYHEWGNATQAG